MKLYVILGAAAALLAALTASHTFAYRAGRSAEQAEIARHINQENENAGEAAEDWRARLRRCVDAGGVYDFETGACNR